MCQISFHTTAEMIDDIPHPFPASQHMPEWFKNLPADWDQGGTLKLSGTIVSNSTGPECTGTIGEGTGHNLDSGTSCGFSGPGDVSGADPRLTGLAANGGLTNLNGGVGYGTVFKITASGTLTNLYSFNDAHDGAIPHAGLVLASDGNFYGTTSQGGVGSIGTIFKLTPAGALTTVYNFPNSGTPGAGTTVRLYLPVETPAQAG